MVYITQLVITSLGGGHTHTHTRKHAFRHSWTKAILRNPALTGIGQRAPSLKIYRKTTMCTTNVLHKTTDRTTQNYTILAGNTTDKIPAHTTDTNQASRTQIQHIDVATHNLHTKLT